jgi:hypothetical protein
MTPQTSRRFANVLPSDSADLAAPTWALVVHTAGAVVVDDDEGNTKTLTVPAGLLPIRVRWVRAAGTTATGITALF